MLKERSYTEDPQEGVERETVFRSETIKNLIENCKVPTDSGKSGILYRVEPENIPPEERELTETDPENNPEGLLSVKVLKVLNLEKARQEFEALQKAREIISEKEEDSSSSAPLFRIPKAIGFDEIEVNKATEDRLNESGASIVGGKVGVITMHWIEGKNLATSHS